MFHILSYLYGSTCQEIMYNSTNANPSCITVRQDIPYTRTKNQKKINTQIKEKPLSDKKELTRQ